MVRFLSALVLLLKASTMVDAGVNKCFPTCVDFTLAGGFHYYLPLSPFTTVLLALTFSRVLKK
jgi:hypothetical protein